MESTKPTAVTSDEKLWAILSHLSGYLSFIPLGNYIIPFAIWIWKRNESPYVEDQSKEALNFQISLTIYFLAIALLVCLYFILGAGALAAYDTSWTRVIDELLRSDESHDFPFPYLFTLYALLGIFGVVGVVVVLAFIGLVVAGLVLPIIALLRVSEEKHYRYPLSFRLVK